MPRAASAQNACHLGCERLLPQGLDFTAPRDLGTSRALKRGLGRRLVSSRQLPEGRFLLPVESPTQTARLQPLPGHRCVCRTGRVHTPRLPRLRFTLEEGEQHRRLERTWCWWEAVELETNLQDEVLGASLLL